jgi:hypothetical protein
MRRFTIVLALLVVAATATAAPALSKEGGTDRPLTGASVGTSTLDLATGTGTTDGTSRLSHFGTTTFHNDFTFTITGDSFNLTGTDTEVAANGDELFSNFTVTGTVSSGASTGVFTITGGTGRFADASGTFTIVATSTIVSTVGTTITSHDTNTIEGRITY